MTFRNSEVRLYSLHGVHEGNKGKSTYQLGRERAKGRFLISEVDLESLLSKTTLTFSLQTQIISCCISSHLSVDQAMCVIADPEKSIKYSTVFQN